MTEIAVERAVRKLFEGSGNAILSQVRNGTGFERAPRTADMLVVSTWPSRGLYADGVEIKVSRSDLKRELQDPAKAEEIAQYCRMWWLAGPEGLFDKDEIPEAWGVIEVGAKGAKITKRGKVNESPAQWSTVFCCSVLRNMASSHVHVDEMNQMIEDKVKKEVERRNEMANDRRKEAEKAVAQWKAETGIDLLTKYGTVAWDLKKMAHAFKLLMAMRTSPLEEIDSALGSLQAASQALRAAVAACADAQNDGMQE